MALISQIRVRGRQWQKMRLAREIVAAPFELTELTLIDDMVVTIGHPVAIKSSLNVFMPNNSGLVPLIGSTKGTTTTDVINVPMGKDHRVKRVMCPRLDSINTAFPAVLIRGIKTDQTVIGFKDNAVRKSLNNSEIIG